MSDRLPPAPTSIPDTPGVGERTAITGDVLFLIPAVICVYAVHVEYLRLEALLIGLVLLTAWTARRRLRWTARPPDWCAPLRRWSRNAFLACAMPAATAVALRLVLLPWIPEPHPTLPDEYSHLFLAKTLLAGRLANPTHPLWPFFETLHIISRPTFSSMYMPGQGLFLAAGKILTGHFFGGVLLSTALFCAALTWFLRACVPPGWALYGGMLAAVRIGAASYWNNSYWGGSVGALGGALALGAFVRLTKRWRPMTALWFAIGVVLLANARPYEGVGLMAVLGVALIWDFARTRGRGRWAALAVAMAVFAIAGVAMAHYFKAVTGSAFTLPYQVNQRTYGWPMTLPWSKARKVEYAHPEFELYRQFEIEEHKYLTDPVSIPVGALLKYALWWRFLFGVGLSATFLYTTPILGTRRLRIIWIAAGVVALMVLTEQSGSPHYLAPAVPAIFLFAVMGLRFLSQTRSVIAMAMVRAIVPVWLVLLGARGVELSPRTPVSVDRNFLSWCCTDVRLQDREPLLEKIAAHPGKHLVIVTNELSRYDAFEWVYNEPDIDRSRVIFARDMGAEKNRELLAYYPDRRVWHVLIRGNGASLR